MYHMLSLSTLATILAGTAPGDIAPIIPVIEEPWWPVASTPRLPDAYHSDKLEPVDFAVWQAADSTWQLWSCIRHTNCGGHTRLLYGWEGQRLFNTDWTPKGIKMEARPDLGEAQGGLQAPHVVRFPDRFLMAYGDWEHICFAESQDGKNFERIVQSGGRTGVFGEGPGSNTRDAMLVNIGDLWYCYYTAILNGKGYGMCRTSSDLAQWSFPSVVSYGGKIGPGPWFNECPHVVEVVPGEFVYFRNQYYGKNQTNWAYYSRNPLNFGIDDDTHLVAQLPVAAPEIILHGDKYYIASLKPGLNGIQIARLRFYRRGELGAPVFDLDDAAGREGWRVTEGAFEVVFCDKPHADFEAPGEFVIGTCETSGGTFDDAMTGVIESPPFKLTADRYAIFVGGGSDREKIHVALVDADTGEELARYTGTVSNRVERCTFEPGESKNRQARIRIIDRATGPWGHINFGGLYEEGPMTLIR
jgi:hypothetical protein